LGALVGLLGAATSAVVLTGDRRLPFVLGFLVLPIVLVGGAWASGIQALDVRRWNRLRIVQPIAYLSTLVGLWALGRLTVVTAVVTFAASVAVQTTLAAWSVSRLARGASHGPTDVLARLFAYGFRALLSAVPWQVNFRLDQVLLALMVPARDLGLYVAAVTLTSLAVPVTAAFGSVAFPALAAAQHPQAAARLQQQAIVGSVCSAVAVLVPVAVAAPILASLAFGPAFAEAATPLRILAVGATALSVNQVLGDLLRGRGRPGVVARAEGLAAAVTIGLLPLLVPPLGIAGAALTSTFAYFVASAMLIRGLQRP
jgi:O-antigen/teichoic acid export membrane protein